MSEAPVRPVLQDISARLINPLNKREANVSAFKSVVKGGSVRRRSSSLHGENRAVRQHVFTNNEWSMPNLTDAAVDLTTTASAACKTEVHPNMPQSTKLAIRKSHMPAALKNSVEEIAKSDVVDSMYQSNQTYKNVRLELGSKNQLRETSINKAGMIDVESMTARPNNSALSESLLRDEIKSLCLERDGLHLDVNSLRSLLADADVRLQQETEILQRQASEERNQLHRENEILQSRIHDLEGNFSQHERLFESAEQNLSLEIRALQQRIVILQCDVKSAHEEKAEMCKKYQDSYHSALQSVHELQAQLGQYSHLQQNIEEAMGVQQSVAELIKKAHLGVKKMHEKNSLLRAELDAEKERLLVQSTEYKCAISEHDEIKHQFNDLTSKLTAALEEIKSVEFALQTEQHEKEAVLVKLQSEEQQGNLLQQEINELNHRHELEMNTLKKTLEARVHDVTECSCRADRLAKIVKYQKKELAKLQMEFSSAQELCQKLEFVEAELKDAVDTKDLLDHERSLLMAELSDMHVKLEQFNAHNLSLSNQRALLECSNHHLKTELNSSSNSIDNLVRELVGLHENLLMQAGHWSQLAASFTANVKSVGLDPVRESLMPASESCVGVQQMKTPSSFIHLVLNAMETCHHTSEQDQQKPAIANHCECESLASGISPKTPSRASRNDIQSTPGFSAFRSLPAGRIQRNLSARANFKHDEESKKNVPVKVDSSNESSHSSHGDDADIGDLLSRGSPNDDLAKRAQEAATSLSDIRTVMHQLQHSINSTVSSLRSQLEIANVSMKNECASRDLDIQCAREALRESQLAVSEIKQTADKALRELTVVRQENTQLKSDLKDARCQLKQRADMVVQCYDQTVNIKKLQKEIIERDAEVSALKEIIQARLAQLDSDCGVEQLIDENRRLIADKTKLLNTLSEGKRLNSVEERELRETSKLSAFNLKKAEQALSVLNDKVERVRQALRPHVELLKADEKMLLAMREIAVFAED